MYTLQYSTITNPTIIISMLSFQYQPLNVFDDFSRVSSPYYSSYGHCSRAVHPQHNHLDYRARRNHRQESNPFAKRQHESDRPLNLFDILLNNAPAAYEKPAVDVYSRVLEGDNDVFLQIRKSDNSNDFQSYSIEYKLVGRNLNITIESKDDEFQKTFQFNNDAVSIKGISWKIINNILSIKVPKVSAKKSFITPQAKQTHLHHHHQTHSPSVVSRKQVNDKKSKPKARVISIPIESESQEEELVRTVTPTKPEPLVESFEMSSGATTPSDSLSRTTSKTDSDLEEDSPSRKLPKLSKRVSIEDVEDESFQ